MVVKSYDSKYKYGVIKCLQRNFEWMNKVSEQTVDDWLKPIISYNFGDKDVSKEEYPYKHGAVLIENDEVVGFFGMISFKEKDDNNNEYIFVSSSTWTIDESFRGYFFQALNEILKPNVNYFEITPIPSVAAILEKFYGFYKCGSFEYRLLPIPCELDALVCRWIENDTELKNYDLKIDYLNHSNNYGIRLVEVVEKSTGETCNLFYKVYDEKSCRIKILKIDKPNIFSNHAHEVSWKIVNKEFYSANDNNDAVIKIIDNMYNKIKVCIECDDILLCGNKLNHPLIKTSNVTRMVRPQTETKNHPMNFLYTEFALLSSHI